MLVMSPANDATLNRLTGSPASASATSPISLPEPRSIVPSTSYEASHQHSQHQQHQHPHQPYPWVPPPPPPPPPFATAMAAAAASGVYIKDGQIQSMPMASHGASAFNEMPFHGAGGSGFYEHARGAHLVKRERRSRKAPHELLTEAEKKANHIASEQKRRQNIRMGFDQLIDSVPTLNHGNRSEALILQKSVEHIRYLISTKNDLKNQVRDLQSILGDAEYEEDSSDDDQSYSK